MTESVKIGRNKFAFLECEMARVQFVQLCKVRRQKAHTNDAMMPSVSPNSRDYKERQVDRKERDSW